MIGKKHLNKMVFLKTSVLNQGFSFIFFPFFSVNNVSSSFSNSVYGVMI